MLLAAFPTPLGRDFSDFFTPLGRDFRDFFTPLGVDCPFRGCAGDWVVRCRKASWGCFGGRHLLEFFVTLCFGRCGQM